MQPRTTFASATWFFLPLIFTAELMFISHSVIQAFLARLEGATVTLAAFSIAFIFHGTLGSPVWAGMQYSLSYVADRRSLARLLWFHFQVAVLPTAVMLFVAFSAFGDWVFQGMLGASAETSGEAREAMFYFILVFYVVPFRNISSAILMLRRRTFLITLGTAVRLASLAGFLYVLPFWVEGASIGSLALFLCIATESVFDTLMAAGLYRSLPVSQEPPPSYWEMWRFSWPLMVNQAAESSVFLFINFFLGRLARPDLALAAFGVMRGIVMLLLSPLRNLVQTAQALTRTAEDLRVVLWFSLGVISFFSLVVLLLFLSPGRDWVLYPVMGLSRELGGYIAPWLPLSFFLGLFWGSSSVFRGLVIAARRTGGLTRSAALRVTLVIAVGSWALAFPEVNGALLGMIAVIAAFAAEAAVLGRQLFQGKKSAPHFPAA